MSGFADALAAVPTPAPLTRTPRGWSPSLEVGDRSATIVTSPYTPAVSPVEHSAVIASHGLDPDAWVVVGFRSSRWQAANGTDLEATRLSLVPAALAGGAVEADVDLEALHRAARRARPAAPRSSKRLRPDEATTLVVALSDFQVGKSDHRGGTAELLERLEAHRAGLIAHARRVRPGHILLLDLGDAIENFENTLQQSRTNDLQLTQQLRLWRRILFSFVETCAQLAPSVTVAAVPSNHCRVRKGKDAVAGPSDDYGLEALAQVMDICAQAPALQHVTFVVPPEHDESLAIRLPGGKIVAATHGHLFRQSDKVAVWWAGQALGASDVGSADILIYGHHHHVRIEAISDTKWSLGAPTADNGSAWWRNLSGRDSAPAVMTIVVDAAGWRDLVFL